MPHADLFVNAQRRRCLQCCSASNYRSRTYIHRSHTSIVVLFEMGGKAKPTKQLPLPHLAPFSNSSSCPILNNQLTHSTAAEIAKKTMAATANVCLLLPAALFGFFAAVL
jgi:hypothetical protein